MLFSALLFLWLFLPLVLLLSWTAPKNWQNGLLLFASLFFYAWGGVSYTAILIVSILFNYFIGIQIERRIESRWPLALGVFINLTLLAVFKYANFTVLNLNFFLEKLEIAPINIPEILLPLGISFYTFQAISYLFDVKRAIVPAQRSLTKLGLYIALFPQLIAGPIVRYHDINQQLNARIRNWSSISIGLQVFIIGLGKKVLLANNFGALADDIFNSNFGVLSVGDAWLGVLCYSLQIFFDFSGYSEMAIGLGKLFGFDLPVNFRYPYIARSVKDFWRRWHITLSTWFRDYLYIPLGGNKKGSIATYRNLLLVFFATGLWHGASWNFILWGLWHGFFLILERQKWLPFGNNKWWGHIYLLLVVTLGWVLFKIEKLSDAVLYYKAMLGLNINTESIDLNNYQHIEFAILLLLGLLISTPIFSSIHQYFTARSKTNRWVLEMYGLFQATGLILIFIYCNLYLITSQYNPFIYFRF